MANITKESQIIDYSTIKSACEKIKDIAADFKGVGDDVKSAGEQCTEKVLSVDGLTMQPTLYELADVIRSFEQKVIEFAESIEGAAKQVQTAQKNQLKEYKEQQKAKEEKSKKNK